ncbi:hypothetical protein LJB98_04005 [Bacteroidales bacterium OttesenSCG-928-M11]|nr:hypothetical protein [Bacteroidales bacterium OttesenSCG-928-M11]
MNKKLLLLLMAIFCFIANNASAQEIIKSNEDSGKGFYFSIGGGYSLGTAKTNGGGNGLMPTQNVSTTSTTTITKPDGSYKSTTKSSTTKKNAAYSLGEGTNISMNFGYMLSKNVGIELGANYLMGTEANIEEKTSNNTIHKYSVKIGSVTHLGGGSVRNINKKEYGMTRNSFSLIPAIKLVAPVGNKTSLYSRFGVVVPIMDNVDYEYDIYNKSSSTRPGNESESSSNENKKIEFKSYFNLGYTAALGINYKLGKATSFFAEVNLVSSSFEVKESEITEWTSSSNGKSKKDLLEGKNTKDIKTSYEKEYVVTNNTPSQDKNKPTKDVSFSLPASSLGVTIGFAFKF